MVGQFWNELAIKRGLYASAINSFQPSCTSLSFLLSTPSQSVNLGIAVLKGGGGGTGEQTSEVVASTFQLYTPDVSYPIFWVLIK